MVERGENRVTCSHCKHSWYKRTERPLQCPKCTSRLWDKSVANTSINKGPELKSDINMEGDL